ncbi:MAG: GNAT family N-acetyltransferase, partial [Actinobacteria bacterium]|nr:GNAT family N-acetyltransferase [Actinomycetota bacterium]
MSTTVDTSLAKTVIRQARASDADRVYLLLEQLEPAYSPDRAAFDTNFPLLLDDVSTSLLLVAENSVGSVIGYALTTITPLLHANGSSAQLQELVVDDAHRGEGVGTAIVEEVERVCRERSVRQITVASRRSADFYERIGYRSSADFLKRTF